MTEIDDKALKRAAHAWFEGCRRLGVRIEAPFDLEGESSVVTCVAFLPDFGGPGGMVIGAMDLPATMPDEWLQRLAKAQGLFVSNINVTAFAESKPEEKVFKSALEDWGYFGPAEERPCWLSPNSP